MPRLMSEFNSEQFLSHCRNTKPPYECPHAACGRTYRSYPGILHHMNNFDHEIVGPKNFHTESGKGESEHIPVPLSTDLKMIEVDLDGKVTNFSVYDPIEIVSKEMFEASLPPVVDEPPVFEQAKTPVPKLGKSCAIKTPKNRTVEKDRGIDVQRYTIEDKKTHKLPEAAFKIISDYYKNIDDAPKVGEEYVCFVEKSLEELDEEVEYDMDEEDRAWLEIINGRRREEGLDLVTMEHFELLMDRLEKESFFQAQCSGRDAVVPIDEDAVCCICMDGECQNSNVILFCDMCNLAVHQECYGVPYIPEGQWLCRRCLQSPSRAVDCALCPNKGGAFKQTDDNRWAHVVCAMWIPEVCFANTVFLEPIDSIGNIPPARWKLTCYICVQRSVGACIQCNKVNCYTAFHVTCAQQAGLHMKIDAVRETSSVGTSVTVRKAAYCDAHTPADSDARPQIDDAMDSAKKAAAKAASRQKMKKARKILAEKRSAAPVVSVPILPADSISPYYFGSVNSVPVPPWNKIQHLATLITIEKRSKFINRLLAYWTLKRQSRNGVSLLRRLTSSYARRNALNSSNSNKVRSPTRSPSLSPKFNRKKITEKAAVEKPQPEEKDMKLKEEMELWQKLRQDLERARLLCELIRKRERMKKELVKVKAEENFVQLSPFVHLLLQTIDTLQEKDSQQIFAEPVDFDEVPDYLDFVKHPMDLSTMRQKAQTHQYQTIEQFSADFDLMIDNCLNYNSKDTIFYRHAVRLRDLGGTIIRQLSRDVEIIGFDPATGLLHSERPKPPPGVSDHSLIREVDDYLNNDAPEDETLEERKTRLFHLLDRVNALKHPVSRIKKIKLLRREIGVVRRKLASQSHEVKVESDDNKTRLKETKNEDRDIVVDDDDDDEMETKSPNPSGKSSSTDNQPQTGCNDIEIKPGSDMGGSKGDSANDHKLSPSASQDSITPNKSTPDQKSKKLFQPKIGEKQKITSSAKKTTPLRSVSRKKNVKKSDGKQLKMDSFICKNEKKSNFAVENANAELQCNTDVPNEKEKSSDHSFLSVKKRGRPPRPSTLPGSKSIDKRVEDKSVDSPPDEESTDNSSSKTDGDFELTPQNPTHPDNTADEGNSGASKEPSPISKQASDVAQPSNPDPDVSANQHKISEVLEAPVEETRTSGNMLNASNFELGLSVVDLDTDKEAVLSKDSFRKYRQGGFINESEDETQSSASKSTLSDSDDESCSDSGSGNYDSDSDSSDDLESGHGSAGASVNQIPLEPLDLVWAKCRGYPWYPALIINPKMPRTGYFHNRVPIPVPPDEVLAHASNYTTPIYLVLFFDLKRTWQWLPRNKLEPLGENSALDKAKLVESRKPADRKAVKKAYEKAILHRCRVTGENTGLSEDSETEEQKDFQN